MGLIDKLQNKVVFLDSAPLIYHIEQTGDCLEMTEFMFNANRKGVFQFVTSTMTFHEVLVAPFKNKQFELAERFRVALQKSKTMAIYSISEDIAIRAAEYRAKYGIKAPDAFQFAVAERACADFFLTNDIRLRAINELEVLVLNELEL